MFILIVFLFCLFFYFYDKLSNRQKSYISYSATYTLKGDIIVPLRSEVQWASVCVGHWGVEPREDVGQQNSNQLRR